MKRMDGSLAACGSGDLVHWRGQINLNRTLRKIKSTFSVVCPIRLHPVQSVFEFRRFLSDLCVLRLQRSCLSFLGLYHLASAPLEGSSGNASLSSHTRRRQAWQRAQELPTESSLE